MNIEEEIFKGCKCDFNRLVDYGFKENCGKFEYKKNIMDNKFLVKIVVDKSGSVYGKVIDKTFNDEYTNFRIEKIVGEFVGKVKSAYVNLLQDIRDKWFLKQDFTMPQSNRVARLIFEKYAVIPEFLWDKYPNFGVFRNKTSNKWFALIADVEYKKLKIEKSGFTDIINLKLDDLVKDYLDGEGALPAYHLNKKNWITILLNDTYSDEYILNLVDISFVNSDKNNVKKD